MKCPIHKDTDLVCFCPKCRGAVKSERKKRAARKNAKRGGRPKGTRDSKPRKRRWWKKEEAESKGRAS